MSYQPTNITYSQLANYQAQADYTSIILAEQMIYAIRLMTSICFRICISLYANGLTTPSYSLI